MKIPPKARLIYALTLVGILVWLAALGLAPYLRSRGVGANALIYSVFAPTCHQIPSRCFHLWGQPMAVCGRCTGVYAGFLAGMLTCLVLKRLGRTRPPGVLSLILWTAPMAADGLGNFFRLWVSTNGVRFATGFIWGTILPFYLLAGLNSLFLGSRAEQSRSLETRGNSS